MRQLASGKYSECPHAIRREPNSYLRSCLLSKPVFIQEQIILLPLLNIFDEAPLSKERHKQPVFILAICARDGGRIEILYEINLMFQLSRQPVIFKSQHVLRGRNSLSLEKFEQEIGEARSRSAAAVEETETDRETDG